MTAGRGTKIEENMIITLAIFINSCIGFFVWYRLGKQSVINDLMKQLIKAGKLIDSQQIAIEVLKKNLAKKEEEK